MSPFDRQPPEVHARLGRLEFLADLAYNAFGPGSENRWGCLTWMVGLGLVAVGIGAILFRLA
jgi:hypothetical protein